MTEKYEYCSTVPRTFVQDCTFNKVLGTVRCQDTSYGKGAYVSIVHPL